MSTKKQEIYQKALDYANGAKLPSCDYQCEELEKAFIAGYNAASWETPEFDDAIEQLLLHKPERESMIKAIEELSELQTKLLQWISKGQRQVGERVL